MRSFLILHGLANHRPPEAWHHWLASELRAAGERVLYPQLPDPDRPSYAAWSAALEAQLAAMADGAGGEARAERVVVCHSLSCLLWLRTAAERPVGARPRADRLLLVAPPAPEQLPEAGAAFRVEAPDGEAARRSATTRIRLACGEGDPYDPDGRARAWGDPLGADVDVLAGAGHVNPDSGYGPWPAALAWCLDPDERLRPNR
jgi:predicted alpha/beta hydrolase family esterase